MPVLLAEPIGNEFRAKYSCGLEQVLATSSDRLGDLWLQSLRNGYQDRDVFLEYLTKDLEGSLEDQIDVAKLRRDQLRMYALMDDPATRIRIPRRLKATIRKTEDGSAWEVDRPKDATTLYVHFRACSSETPVRPRDVDQQRATELHGTANRLFAYDPVETLTGEQEWSGVVRKRGQLRLVAVAPLAWYAIVLNVGD